MNRYRFEDLRIGIEEHFQVTVTACMKEEFYKITGDCNPLHVDRQFAMERHYPDCVVYGMLTASFISTLAGMYLPGRLCLIQSVESKFIQPVFIGDELRVSGMVEKLHESVKQAEIKILILNQKHDKVLRGKLKVGFLDE